MDWLEIEGIGLTFFKYMKSFSVPILLIIKVNLSMANLKMVRVGFWSFIWSGRI